MNSLTVRIIDNILEEANFTNYELFFDLVKEKPTVVKQCVLRQGVYREHLLGYSLDQLSKWLRYSPTGHHPEVWHELFDPKCNTWFSYFTEIQLLNLILDESSSQLPDSPQQKQLDIENNSRENHTSTANYIEVLNEVADNLDFQVKQKKAAISLSIKNAKFIEIALRTLTEYLVQKEYLVKD